MVQQNDALYKTSIADTKQWLNKNFTKNKNAKDFHAELDRLNAIQLQSHFPDISKSLKMLKDITKLRIESDKAMMKPKPDKKSVQVKPPVNSVEPVKPVEKTESVKPVAP
jgi:uncharacterized protein HemX